MARNNDLIVVSDPMAYGAYWNGFFGASPRHPGIRAAINEVIVNVKTCFYGRRDLAPTGPILFGKVLKDYKKLVLPAHYHGEILHLGDPDMIHNKFPGYRAIYAKMGYNKDQRSYGHLYNKGIIYRNCLRRSAAAARAYN